MKTTAELDDSLLTEGLSPYLGPPDILAKRPSRIRIRRRETTWKRFCSALRTLFNKIF